MLDSRSLIDEYPPNRIGVVLSNAMSSLETDIAFYKSTSGVASPSLFVYTLPNIVLGEICIRHRLKGENAFFIFEKFDSGFMHNYIDALLQKSVQVCLAGWVEVYNTHFEAFLYLVEMRKGEFGVEHTGENVLKLYISE